MKEFVKFLAAAVASSVRMAMCCARAPFLAVWVPVARMRKRASWPETVESAVQHLLTRLDEPSLERVRSCPLEDLPLVDLSLGQSVRNAFGLWEGNKSLLRSCGSESMHPDLASAVIVNALWERLRSKHTGAAQS
jgi:hypothetical protein